MIQADCNVLVIFLMDKVPFDANDGLFGSNIIYKQFLFHLKPLVYAKLAGYSVELHRQNQPNYKGTGHWVMPLYTTGSCLFTRLVGIFGTLSISLLQRQDMKWSWRMTESIVELKVRRHLSVNQTHFAGAQLARFDRAIIGGVLGGVGFLLLVLAIFLRHLYTRKKKVGSRGDEQGSTELQGTETYNYQDLKLATKSFSQDYKLGEGGSGDVYKGIVNHGKIVAVKRLASSTSKAKADFESEISLISNVHHRNLIRLLGCSSEGPDLLLVYEYMENGSLDSFLYGGKRGTLNWKKRFDIILGAARGLAYLHDQFNGRIIHRDIKPGNILLDDELQPKIADFGLARLLPEDQTHFNTRFAGTLGYTAPEYAIQGHLSEKVDTYSFGVMLLEIISGRRCSDTHMECKTDFLLELAWKLHANSLHHKLIDATLDPDEYKLEDAQKIVKIGLMCTQSPASLRPTMSEVVILLIRDGLLEPVPISRPVFVHSKNTICEIPAQSSISKYTSTLSEPNGR
ncbi:Protein kinase domain-containing protein [Heracleum sosnowskyi]|uniref:Protein kinase domain-containing protein n=1 Tax=Heracleum sosnowskyi TaxID=360622 RepID=A0AAD8JDP7_9APIA|nr:Protein kinase domain-containing protein [Heracleum sosnowskyi]